MEQPEKSRNAAPSAAFQRLLLITGEQALEKLAHTRVSVLGLGGVGGWCAEALVRSGIGHITLIDSDVVCVTNINRQIQATTLTIGDSKTAALRARLETINPACTITVYDKIFSKETEDDFALDKTDFIIDAIDSLSCKIDLIEKSAALGKTLFSSMGMAQKMDPVRIKTAGIWETSGCPLARRVRAELRKRHFTGDFTAVYSTEQLPRQNAPGVLCGSAHCLCPRTETAHHEWCGSKKVINGSAVPVTAAAGMVLASLVLRKVVSGE